MEDIRVSESDLDDTLRQLEEPDVSLDEDEVPFEIPRD